MTQVHTPNELQVSEAGYFNVQHCIEVALGIEPLPQFDRRRYSNPSANTIWPREFFYQLFAPLAGTDVLEGACGNGFDTCIAARNQANVYAYVLSPAVIDMTRWRATRRFTAVTAQRRLTRSRGVPH